MPTRRNQTTGEVVPWSAAQKVIVSAFWYTRRCVWREEYNRQMFMNEQVIAERKTEHARQPQRVCGVAVDRRRTERGGS